jgi:hypothetical protein
VKTRQDHILLGAEDIFEHPEYLDVHGLHLCTFEDRVGDTMEAAVHV